MQDGATYRVAKVVRDCLVFANQDVTKDPPFSRVDLISCRNLLIYMDGDLQQRLMPLFHYALNVDGYLFLGSSETLGDSADLFVPVDRKWKLFQRRGTVTPREKLLASAMPMPGAAVGRRADVMQPPLRLRVRDLAEKALLTSTRRPAWSSTPRATSSTSTATPAATSSLRPASPAAASTRWPARACGSSSPPACARR